MFDMALILGSCYTEPVPKGEERDKRTVSRRALPCVRRLYRSLRGSGGYTEPVPKGKNAPPTHLRLLLGGVALQHGVHVSTYSKSTSPIHFDTKESPCGSQYPGLRTASIYFSHTLCTRKSR